MLDAARRVALLRQPAGWGLCRLTLSGAELPATLYPAALLRDTAGLAVPAAAVPELPAAVERGGPAGCVYGCSGE